MCVSSKRISNLQPLFSIALLPLSDSRSVLNETGPLFTQQMMESLELSSVIFTVRTVIIGNKSCPYYLAVLCPTATA